MYFMCLIKKYIFIIVEIVEIIMNIVNEICKNMSDLIEIKNILVKYVVICNIIC